MLLCACICYFYATFMRVNAPCILVNTTCILVNATFMLVNATCLCHVYSFKCYLYFSRMVINLLFYVFLPNHFRNVHSLNSKKINDSQFLKREIESVFIELFIIQDTKTKCTKTITKQDRSLAFIERENGKNLSESIH